MMVPNVNGRTVSSATEDVLSVYSESALADAVQVMDTLDDELIATIEFLSDVIDDSEHMAHYHAICDDDFGFSNDTAMTKYGAAPSIPVRNSNHSNKTGSPSKTVDPIEDFWPTVDK